MAISTADKKKNDSWAAPVIKLMAKNKPNEFMSFKKLTANSY
jgi:hypothetical protein